MHAKTIGEYFLLNSEGGFRRADLQYDYGHGFVRITSPVSGAMAKEPLAGDVNAVPPSQGSAPRTQESDSHAGPRSRAEERFALASEEHKMTIAAHRK